MTNVGSLSVDLVASVAMKTLARSILFLSLLAVVMLPVDAHAAPVVMAVVAGFAQGSLIVAGAASVFSWAAFAGSLLVNVLSPALKPKAQQEGTCHAEQRA